MAWQSLTIPNSCMKFYWKNDFFLFRFNRNQLWLVLWVRWIFATANFFNVHNCLASRKEISIEVWIAIAKLYKLINAPSRQKTLCRMVASTHKLEEHGLQHKIILIIYEFKISIMKEDLKEDCHCKKVDFDVKTHDVKSLWHDLVMTTISYNNNISMWSGVGREPEIKSLYYHQKC